MNSAYINHLNIQNMVKMRTSICLYLYVCYTAIKTFGISMVRLWKRDVEASSDIDLRLDLGFD